MPAWMEMAYTVDSKSTVVRHAGSNPAAGTKKKQKYCKGSCYACVLLSTKQNLLQMEKRHWRKNEVSTVLM